MKTFKRLTLLVFGICFAIIMAEISLRLLGFEHNSLSILYDPDCYWRLAPNQRFHFLDDFNTPCTVSINSIGSRGPELPREKITEEKRLICLGDSYTYGWGVDQEKTFPSRLQTLLASYAKPFRVINYGCNGYTILQEVNLLKKYGLPLKPDYVLVDASLNTDFLDIEELSINLKYMPLPGYNVIKTLTRKTAIGNLLLRVWAIRKKHDILSFRGARQRAQNLANTNLSHHSPPPSIASAKPHAVSVSIPVPVTVLPDLNNESFSIYIKKLDELVELSKEHGFKLIYVISPWGTSTLVTANIGHFSWDGVSINTAEQFCHLLHTRYGNAMTVIELMSSFRDPKLFLKDGHLNAEGNDLAAKIIYSKIVSIL